MPGPVRAGPIIDIRLVFFSTTCQPTVISVRSQVSRNYQTLTAALQAVYPNPDVCPTQIEGRLESADICRYDSFSKAVCNL